MTDLRRSPIMYLLNQLHDNAPHSSVKQLQGMFCKNRGLTLRMLNKQMMFQIDSCSARILALLSAEGLILRVHIQMLFQTASCFEGKVALIATKRFLFCVHKYVTF